jgi:hypothetical protein
MLISLVNINPGCKQQIAAFLSILVVVVQLTVAVIAEAQQAKKVPLTSTI